MKTYPITMLVLSAIGLLGVMPVYANGISSQVRAVNQHIKPSHHAVAANNAKTKASVDDSAEDNDVELKTLDLTVPFKTADSSLAQSNLEKQILEQEIDAIPLALDNATNKDSLKLNGGLLLSPYQEPEKLKLLDGASIIFSLKH
ncbi:MAG: hypothetical protein WC782_02950 [Methylococcaceae bacterium]|jgi:hypothetical protein